MFFFVISYFKLLINRTIFELLTRFFFPKYNIILHPKLLKVKFPINLRSSSALASDASPTEQLASI